MKHWDRYMETRGKYLDEVIITYHPEDAQDRWTQKRKRMYEARGKTVTIKTVDE